MENTKKAKRYERLHKQIKDLIEKSSNNYLSDMATVCAVLHHKMEYFFWTGFYLLQDGKLQVAAYQGPLACIDLKKNTGVCWAGITRNETVVVGNVEEFPDHIACDSRSKSEIVIPLYNTSGEIVGVMDVDSTSLNSFNDTDAAWLQKIVGLIRIERDVYRK